MNEYYSVDNHTCLEMKEPFLSKHYDVLICKKECPKLRQHFCYIMYPEHIDNLYDKICADIKLVTDCQIYNDIHYSSFIDSDNDVYDIYEHISNKYPEIAEKYRDNIIRSTSRLSNSCKTYLDIKCIDRKLWKYITLLGICDLSIEESYTLLSGKSVCILNYYPEQYEIMSKQYDIKELTAITIYKNY